MKIYKIINQKQKIYHKSMIKQKKNKKMNKKDRQMMINC